MNTTDIAAAIMGSLVREGILDVKDSWNTFKPEKWILIIKEELDSFHIDSLKPPPKAA